MTQDQIRAALDKLESRMDTRLDRIETKLDDALPRMAVLERRADDRDKKTGRNWQTWIALGASAVALVGSIIAPILGG